MRKILAMAMMLILSACAGQPVTDSTECPQPRPQVCTMEYNPTCAVLQDGSRKEYSSPCNACADEAVSGVLRGPCPE